MDSVDSEIENVMALTFEKMNLDLLSDDNTAPVTTSDHVNESTEEEEDEVESEEESEEEDESEEDYHHSCEREDESDIDYDYKEDDDEEEYHVFRDEPEKSYSVDQGHQITAIVIHEFRSHMIARMDSSFKSPKETVPHMNVSNDLDFMLCGLWGFMNAHYSHCTYEQLFEEFQKGDFESNSSLNNFVCFFAAALEADPESLLPGNKYYKTCTETMKNLMCIVDPALLQEKKMYLSKDHSLIAERCHVLGYYFFYCLSKKSFVFAAFWKSHGSKFFADFISDTMKKCWMRGVSFSVYGVYTEVNIFKDALTNPSSRFVVTERELNNVKYCIQPLDLLFKVFSRVDSVFFQEGNFAQVIKFWLNRCVFDVLILRLINVVQTTSYQHAYPHRVFLPDGSSTIIEPDAKLCFRYFSEQAPEHSVLPPCPSNVSLSTYMPAALEQPLIPSDAKRIVHPSYGMEYDVLSSLAEEKQRSVQKIFQRIVKSADVEKKTDLFYKYESLLTEKKIVYADAREFSHWKNDSRWLLAQLMQFMDLSSDCDRLLWFLSGCGSDCKKPSQICSGHFMNSVFLKMCSYVRTITTLFHSCGSQLISNLITPVQVQFEQRVLHMLVKTVLSPTMKKIVETQLEEDRSNVEHDLVYLLTENMCMDNITPVLWFLGLYHYIVHSRREDMNHDCYFGRLKNVLYKLYISHRRVLLKNTSWGEVPGSPYGEDGNFINVVGKFNKAFFTSLGFITDTNHDVMPYISKWKSVCTDICRLYMSCGEEPFNLRAKMIMQDWNTKRMMRELLIDYFRSTNRADKIPSSLREVPLRSWYEESKELFKERMDAIFERRPNLSFHKIMQDMSEIMAAWDDCTVNWLTRIRKENVCFHLVEQLNIEVSSMTQFCSSIPPSVSLMINDEFYCGWPAYAYNWVFLDGTLKDDSHPTDIKREQGFLYNGIVGSKTYRNLLIGLHGIGPSTEEKELAVERIRTNLRKVYYHMVIRHHEMQGVERLPENCYDSSLSELMEIIRAHPSDGIDYISKMDHVTIACIPSKLDDWCLDKPELFPWKQSMYDQSTFHFMCEDVDIGDMIDWSKEE